MPTIHRRTAAIAAIIVLGLASALVSTMPRAAAASAVPTCPSTTLTRSGAQTSAITGANPGTWDLTGAAWVRTSHYADVNSDPTTRGCITGGSTDGGISATATRDCWFDGIDCIKSGKGDGYTMRIANSASNWGVIADAHTEDYEDGYDLQTSYTGGGSGGSSAYLDHVEATDIRDDCIENEGSSSDPDVAVDNVYISDSLFDGCFTGIAWRPPGSTSATSGARTDHTLTIEDSLIHIGNQPLGSKYCTATSVSNGRCLANGSTYLGNYGLWKWSDDAPADGNVVMSDTIVKIDGQSYSSCKPFDWPGGTYRNVTLVWDSPTSYTSVCSGSAYALPAGVTFTTDTSVWTDAVHTWRHGGGSTNTAPTVDSGTDHTVTLPSSAALDGTVSDDGLPTGSRVTTTWSKVSGPGTVRFDNTSAVDTTASFSASGTYVLRLTANDTALSSSDDVRVTVNAAPSIGISYVGSAHVSDVDHNVTATIPAAARAGDVVIFRSVENRGSKATLNRPAGLTALGGETNSGTALGSRLYHCTMPCSASKYTFTASTKKVNQVSVATTVYRGANAPILVAHRADANGDNLHPVTGTFHSSAWRVEFATDRKVSATSSTTPVTTWTLDSAMTERLDAGFADAGGRSTISQAVGDTAGEVAPGSSTYAATGSQPTPYALTALVELTPAR